MIKAGPTPTILTFLGRRPIWTASLGRKPSLNRQMWSTSSRPSCRSRATCCPETHRPEAAALVGHGVRFRHQFHSITLCESLPLVRFPRCGLSHGPRAPVLVRNRVVAPFSDDESAPRVILHF